jgi:hypothetical protein
VKIPLDLMLTGYEVLGLFHEKDPAFAGLFFGARFNPAIKKERK